MLKHTLICILLLAPALATAQDEAADESGTAEAGGEASVSAEVDVGVDADVDVATDGSATSDGTLDADASGDGSTSMAGDGSAPDSSGTAADPTQSGLLSDDQVLAEEEMGQETVRSGTDPYEDPTKNYYSIGAFYHHTWTPLGILKLFTEDAVSANNIAVGGEFTYRKDGFDIIVSGWYQQFHVNGPFRADGDDPTETEIINSNLATVFLGATFLWGTAFNDIISLQYGLSVGLGAVFGDLRRTEAYRDGSDRWQPCMRAGSPATPENFCDGPEVQDGEEGGHYNIVARNWTNGGSVPIVWIRIAPQISLRIKPIKQFIMRVDVGYDIFSGFYVGGALAYGFGG